MKRKLSLMNDLGDLIDLNDVNSFYATELSGLGISIGNSYYESGSRNILDKSMPALSQITITINTARGRDVAYEKFKELTELLNHPPYRLIYESAAGEYKRDCILAELTKGELTGTKRFSESLVLDFLTPWYRWIYEEKRIVDFTIGAGKIYKRLPSDKNYVSSVVNKLYTQAQTANRVEVTTLDTPLANIKTACEATIDLSLIFSESKTAWYLVTDSTGNKCGEIYITEQMDVDLTNFKTLLKFTSLHVGAKLYLIDFAPKNADAIRINSMKVKPYQNSGAFVYPYVFGGFDQGKGGVFDLENKSIYMGLTSASPIEIEIMGPSSNPSWDVVQNYNILYSDGFNLDIPADYRLIVSSNPSDQKAILVAPDGTTSNVYKQQNLSKSNFVKIPSGQSKITFKNVENVKFKYREEKVVV